MPTQQKNRKNVKRGKRYTEESLYREREYGLFWYAWLWKILRPVLIGICALAIVFGLVASGWNKVYEGFLSPVNSEDTEPRTFVIESGSSVSTVGKNLYEQGFLRNRGLFGYIIQFRGLTNSIQYGNYQLSPSMDIFSIIDVLSSGGGGNERTIQIIPGWGVEEIAAYLVQEGALANTDEFLSLCRQPELFADNSFVLTDAGNESSGFTGRLYALEGYLSPDTYRIYTDASAESIIRKLLQQTNKVVNDIFYAQDAGVAYDANGNIVDITDGTEIYESPLTQDETIILASIIEKEAGSKEDYGKVSAVFHNRLKQGMKLESDATITYVTGVRHLALSGEELATDSPYNTYNVNGLPPGPICNPSAAAIRAALYPDMKYLNGGALYFCSKEPESGELAFAKTYEQHQANVEKYRPSWIEYDKKQAEKNGN